MYILTNGIMTSNIDWNIGKVYIINIAPFRLITLLFVFSSWKFKDPIKTPVAMAAIVLKNVAWRSLNLTINVLHAMK